jgi:pimeloyl-ACP methyl ester carboxylesterase
VSEQVFTFGPGNALVGVLHTASSSYAGPQRPAILMANVGILHRVGPFRLYVDLARRLAALGFPVLRFDHSGLGDSSTVRDGRSNRDRFLPEMQQAMELVTKKTGATRFGIVGLCSGADAAHWVAVAEPRVESVVFLDGYAYRTLGYHLRRLTSHYLSPQRWRSFFARRRFAKSRPKQPAGDAAMQVYVQIPPREEAQKGLQSMLDRGVRLLYLYTGGIEYAYNHAGQFAAMYPGLRGAEKVTTELWPDADHTFTMRHHRDQLMRYVCQWLSAT